MTDYAQLGAYTIIPEADLLNLVSKANHPDGDTRFHLTSEGKRPGTTVLVDLGAGVYAKAVAIPAVVGLPNPSAADMAQSNPTKNSISLSSSPWQNPNGTQYVPVNILNPGGGAAWTDVNVTYAAGVLTETVLTGTAHQVVVLKQGNYVIVGTVNRTTADKAAKLLVSGATDGTLVTHYFDTAPVDPTHATTRQFTIRFSLAAASQNVTFTNSIVATADNSDATGSAYLNYSLEGLNASTDV